MSVLIGKRELFAFAERYSSYRLKDYTDLADGVVLCSLFNLVFPDLRIRTANTQTHTLSQRTQMNWSALRAGLDAVGIPQILLNRDALLQGDPEKGFSALVLFYFLHHLTKRTDFSAEFAIDVTAELTEFLQSIDSIAALVAGGSMPLSAVPPPLQEQLRVATLTRRGRSSSRTHPRKKVNTTVSSISSLNTSEMEDDDDDDDEQGQEGNFEKQLSFNSDMTAKGSQSVKEETTPTAKISPKNRDEDYDDIVKTNKNSGNHTYNHKHTSCTKNKKTIDHGKDDLLNVSVVQREVELQKDLIAKSEECEELKMQNLQLLSQLAKLRSETPFNTSSTLASIKSDVAANTTDVAEDKYEEKSRRLAKAEDEVLQLRRILQTTKQECLRQLPQNSTFAQELLEDIVDAETGEVVKVHETATLLNGVILDALRNSPKRRQEAQKWLWQIVSAYHVMETRLVTACDVATLEFKRLEEEEQEQEGCRNNSIYNHACTSDLPSTPGTTAKSAYGLHETSSPLLPYASSKAPALYTQLSKMEAEMGQRQRQFEQHLADLHVSEKNLRRRVKRLQDQLNNIVKKTVEREGMWKSLCASIHEAERASFGIAEAETTVEVERLLAQRQSWYTRADEESEKLMRGTVSLDLNNNSLEMDGNVDNGDGSTISRRNDDHHENDKGEKRDVTGLAGDHDVCEAMQTLVQSVTQDRDRLQREVEELRREVRAAAVLLQSSEKQERKHKLQEDIHNRIVEQREYEEDEVWFVRANARPPFTLSCPSVNQTPLPAQSTKHSSERDTNTMTRTKISFGRNLSALLASVTPSK
ncbi:hypothetical protein LSM04_008290 [Trypanosoma melophagium]|uniref:uncharacterized protein n=1 Tax=Trypanosoma melophagium TaxID=715481 RepID=UPI00351A1188|nr:hypothetical protein LSM04_008290 [Trypanosoma melophagium]